MIARELVLSAKILGSAAGRLHFSSPVTHVYNPLEYAWLAHKAYLLRYGDSRKRVIFLGMNPGPFGMAQTGVPFGEVASVRDWLGIQSKIGKPLQEHPKRPVLGFGCLRSEISGRRLWNLFARRFGSAENFFAENLVLNYCPLAFFESGGRNRTPDKLPAAEKLELFAACDEHLRSILRILQPEWVVGIGDFAARRAEQAISSETARKVRLGRILHPSPANPAANRDWPGAASRQLLALGVWR